MTESTRVPGLALEQDNEGLHLRDCGDCVKQLYRDFGFGDFKGANNLAFEKQHEDHTALDEYGQRRHMQMLGRLLWADGPDVCQLSTHVGTTTNRNEADVKRLLRYLVGNPLCNK